MPYSDLTHQWKIEFSNQRDQLTKELIELLPRLTAAQHRLQQYDQDKIDWLTNLADRHPYLNALSTKIELALEEIRLQQVVVESLTQTRHNLLARIYDLSESILVLND